MNRNGSKLREFRLKAGMSQSQLSYKARICSTTISNIEGGRLYPYPKARKALARVLKVSQTELFPDEQI